MLSDIRVLIVDDQMLVRFGMQRLLENHPDVAQVYEAASGEEAFALARETVFDLALVDLKMPEMDGVETSEKLLEILPALKILIVTASLDELLLPHLFKVGIYGYLAKQSDPAELASAIQTLQADQRYVSPLLATQMQRVSAAPETELGIFDTLSERELQAMLMLISGMSLNKMAEKLHVDVKTVLSYRTRCFNKLKVDNDIELTLLAARRGLLCIKHLTPKPS